MKDLWLGRHARPDIIKPIGDLASHVQKWSRNDEERLHRLMCYLKSTALWQLEGRIGDDYAVLELRLYVDADFCGAADNAKSTSGA